LQLAAWLFPRSCLFVIASQRVAQKRPMTGSAKQSIVAAQMDYFVAVLLATTVSI
jgi:hypothetical protein